MEVALDHEPRIGVGHDVPEPVEPVDGGGLVEGAGDVRDAGTPQRDQVAYGRAGASPVVTVDVHRGRRVAGAVAPAGPAAEHGRHARAVDQLGQRVVEVQREDERAVDVSAGEVPAHPRVVVAALREQQDELRVVRRQLLADAAELETEEGVGEDPGLRFGDDDGDRVVAPGDQAAGSLVGNVTEFLDGLPDPFDEWFAHSVAAVDHT